MTNILTKQTIDKIVYSKMAVHESSWFKEHHILINYEDVKDGDQTIDGKNTSMNISVVSVLVQKMEQGL